MGTDSVACHTDLYAVFGNPVKHSKSPEIHHAFAEQVGHTLTYLKKEVDLDGFALACDEFFNNGGKGLNVTVPFKQQACEYADRVSERAKLAKAANTLSCLDGLIYADNTDGAGLIQDIEHRLKWPIQGQRLLILGAGGAVRGVLKPLLDRHPLEIVIANRTESRARALADDFSAYGTVTAKGFSAVEGSFDLIINATSASLAGELPTVSESIFNPQSHAYDMAYGDDDTVFIAWAKSLGVSACSDGLGMLVGQAAESFYIWRGVRPETQGVIAKLTGKRRST